MRSDSNIVITTGARLHFGFLSHAADSSRQFGGIGLMVDRPGFRVAVQPAASDQIVASDRFRGKIVDILTKYRQQVGSPVSEQGWRIELLREMPSHAGFGSGTQLAMSLATAMGMLSGERSLSRKTLALRTGRGQRSALGIHGFQQGGFLVESGKSPADEIGPLTARVEFPAEWRVVLLSFSEGEGLSGVEEVRAFSMLDPMSEALSGKLCRIVLMDLLPALQGGRFEQFARALQEFGMLIGEYFSPVQGGIFSHPVMNALASALMDEGVTGICQSSWGPTVAIMTPNEPTAKQVVSLVERLCDHPLEISIVSPLNTGAALEFPSPLTEDLEFPSTSGEAEDADDVGQ